MHEERKAEIKWHGTSKIYCKHQHILSKQQSILAVAENNGIYWISEVGRVTIQSIDNKA
jgi:hypothetical protein